MFVGCASRWTQRRSKEKIGACVRNIGKNGGDFFSECAMKTIKLYNTTEADRNIYLDDYPESSNLFKTI